MTWGWLRRPAQRLGRWMPRAFLSVIAAPVRLLPSPVRRGVCFVVFWATARGRPDRALRVLLEMETDLTKSIDHAAMRY